MLLFCHNAHSYASSPAPFIRRRVFSCAQHRKEPVTLTVKQEKFCTAFIETGNASEAYRRAYDAGNMKPETINRKAKELTDNGKIAARVEKLQAAHQKRHEVTVDTISTALDEDRILAHKVGQAGAAVSASMGKAKLHGLVTDKQEHTGKNGGPIELTRIERVIVKAPNTDG